MKTLLAFLLFISPLAAKADIIDDIATAIRKGNSKEISKFLAENIDIKVLDKESIYSRAQAELILKDFFAKHQVQEFTVIRKSQTKNEAQFAIGTLKTSTGNYRVHYLLKMSTGTNTVTQFRIENNDE